MFIFQSRVLLSLATLSLAVSLSAAPVFDPAVPFDPANPSDPYQVPIGKAIVIPLTATDSDGFPLSYTVTSSNPNVLPRVRTGDPHLKLSVSYAGSSASDPAFAGNLEFILFRDLTPKTASIIAGLAEGGFYSPKSGTANGSTQTRTVIFHRVVKNFVIQAGDPNGELPDPTAPLASPGSPLSASNPPTVRVDRGPGFAFDNEYHPALIFAGLGQLAMANSGFDGNFHGTDGSQFFVTTSATRLLDFNYTIFGQLIRGFDLLAAANNVPVGPQPFNPFTSPYDPVQQAPNEEVSKPKTDIQITGAHVFANNTDAVLLLSAVAPTSSPAILTVTADDGHGGKTTTTLKVSAVVDTTNSPPFVSALDDRVAAPGSAITLPLTVTDLEYDYVSTNSAISNASASNPSGFTGITSRNTVAVVGNSQYVDPLTQKTASYIGPLDLYVEAQQYDPTFRPGLDQQQTSRTYSAAEISVGGEALVATPLIVQGVAGAPLTSVAVVSYVVPGVGAKPGDLTATIDWGDGSYTTGLNTAQPPQFVVTPAPATAGTAIADPHPGSKAIQITGSHTYAHGGVYPITVNFVDPAGLDVPNSQVTNTVTSTACITDPSQTVSAVGTALSFTSPKVTNAVVASFSDSASTAGIDPAGYTATVNWGDGAVTQGVVSHAQPSGFAVTGSHAYIDPEKYAIGVAIHKLAGGSADAFAWTTASLSGFTGPKHLPPFDQSHLVGEFSTVPLDARNPNGAPKPTKTTIGNVDVYSQTYLTYKLFVINSGNKPTPYSVLNLYLSPRRTLSASAQPAAIPLRIGPSHTYAIIPPLPAGQGITYTFDSTAAGDFRLMPPANETGAGYNVLAHFTWRDPIADYEPIQRDCVVGKVSGLIVWPQSVQTDAAGAPQYFFVRLDKAPGLDSFGNPAPVTIPLTSSNPTAVTVAPAAITFNNTDWKDWQAVRVAGAAQAGSSTSPLSISVGPASSAGLLAGITGLRVSVSIYNNIVVHAPATVATKDHGAGNTATFTVTLAHRSVAPVTLQITAPQVNANGQGSPQSEGLLSVAGGAPAQSVTLTFEPNDISLTKTVTVTGQLDGQTSGTTSYTIHFSPSASSSADFNNIHPPDINATNSHAP